jgi:hypothetical protein
LDDSLDYEENIDRLLRGEGENPIKWTFPFLLPNAILLHAKAATL